MVHKANEKTAAKISSCDQTGHDFQESGVFCGFIGKKGTRKCRRCGLKEDEAIGRIVKLATEGAFRPGDEGVVGPTESVTERSAVSRAAVVGLTENKLVAPRSITVEDGVVEATCICGQTHFIGEDEAEILQGIIRCPCTRSLKIPFNRTIEAGLTGGQTNGSIYPHA